MLKDRLPRKRPEAQGDGLGETAKGSGLSTPMCLTIAVAPVFLLLIVAYFSMQSSLFTVQTISVNGAISLDQASLAEISGLRGKSMLTLSDEGARRRLMAIPEIYDIKVERSWPSEVVLTVFERRPVAYWSVDGHDLPVDQEGVVLSSGEPEGRAPRIVEVTSGRILNAGDRVHPDAVAFAQRIMTESPRFLDASVYELEYEAGVGVTVIFEGGLRVTFGDDRSYDYKIAVLSTLLQELAGKGIQPSAVDLRFGQRVTYE